MTTKEIETLNSKQNKNKKNKGPDVEQFYEELKILAINKNLSFEQVLEVFKSSLLSVLHKKYGPNANIDIEMDPAKGTFGIYIHYNVVNNVRSPDYEKSLEEAKQIDPEAKIGGTVTINESFENFNRINAHEIRSVFFQKLKDLENELIYYEYKDKKGMIVTAQVMFSKGNKDIHVSIGRADGIIPKNEQMAKDKYPPGKHIKAVIKEVIYKKDSRNKDFGTLIILSRNSADFVKGLFRQEVPEIQEGIVEIVNIVRDPGFRTKMIVDSNRKDVDPVGACLGIRGSRIQNIQREIYNEKIDIIAYSDNPANMISYALSPAKVSETYLDSEKKEALVIVPDYEYNKALGPNGKNVRLASQLLGYKINIKTQKEYREEISDPVKKAKLEALFSMPGEEVEESETEEFTPLEEISGLTKRIIELLKSEGIDSVEKLVETVMDEKDYKMYPERLQKIPGINRNTAEYIIERLMENIEIQDEEA